MKDKHLIYVMIAIMLFFGIASPVIGALSSYGVIENRLATKNLLVTEKYYDEETPMHTALNAVEDLKTDIKNIYINCIPFYNLIVSSVQKTDLALLNYSDGVLQTILYPEEEEDSGEIVTIQDETGESSAQGDTSEPSETEPPKEKIKYVASRLASGRPNIFSIEPLKVLERLEGGSEREFERLLSRQLTYLDRLVEAAPDLNYYCYMGTRIQEAPYYSDIVKMPMSTEPYLKTFMEELNDAYSFDYLRLDTPEDRVAKCYRTDHHWNMFGAYEGYQQIINMMVENTPEIGGPVGYDIVKIEGKQRRLHGQELSGRFLCARSVRYAFLYRQQLQHQIHQPCIHEGSISHRQSLLRLSRRVLSAAG